MTDFASLAIKVDASEVGRGVGELDKLVAAGSRSEQAAAGMDRAFSRVSQSAGAQRAGMQQLSYQIGDVAQQFALGVNPMTIFAQQGGQVVQAIGLMQGEAKGLIGFLGGPWGAVMMGAVTVLGSLYAAHMQAAGGADEQRGAVSALNRELEKLAGNMGRATNVQLGYARMDAETKNATVRRIEAQIAEVKRTAPGLTGKIMGLEKELASARTDASAAVQFLNLAVSQTAKLKATAETASTGTATAARVATRAVRAHVEVKTEEQRQYEAADKTAAAYIERLKIEQSEIGKTAAELRLMAAARAAEKAPTEAQKLEIMKLAMAINDQNAAIAETARLEKERQTAGENASRALSIAVEAQQRKQEEYNRTVADGVRQLQSMGGVAGALGVVGAIATGNTSSLSGTLGYLMNRPVAKNKDGTFQTLGDRIEKIFDKGGTFARALGGVIGELGAGAATAAMIFGANNKAAQTGGALGGLAGFAFGGPLGGLAGALGGGLFGGLFNERKLSLTGGLLGAGAGALLGGAVLGGGSGLAAAAGIGALAGPIGMILGGVVGGLLGALGLSKAKYGTANVRGLGAASISGNNGTYQSNAGASAGALQDALSQIADTLGGGVGGFNVSIGQYKGKWRVSPSGMTGKLNKGDTVDFGKDGAEAAVRYAIANAIADGAITGISASIQKLIQGSGDIEKQLSKALKFQGVFDELKSKTDPLAYSLSQIAKEATALNKIFAEAGAAAEEYAQLEQLLAIKRKEAAEQARKDVVDKIREPYDLYTQMLELLGKNEEALAAQRLIELATLKDSVQPLQAWVYQMQDARKVIETFQPLADELIAYRKELLGGASAQSYGTLAAQFRATAIAAGNGDVAGLSNLRGAASSFLDAAKENAGSALEFQRAQAEVIRAVDKGIFAAETQVDYAQAQLDAINNSANILANMKAEMAAFQAQITENTGLTARLLKRFEGDGGLMVVTTQDQPLQVEVVATV